MSKVVTIRVSDETFAMIDRLAERDDRSRSWVAARLIESGVREATEFAEFIQRGVDAAEAGDFYTQDQMKAWAQSLRGTRKQAA